MNYKITHNSQFNSIEVAFDEVPTYEVRQALKAIRYRWHSVKRVWYGYTTEEEARAAIEGIEVNHEPKTAQEHKPGEKKNRFGVKVGDIFSASWGYEQTNNDFFQVIALCGETSVRVREVRPVCEKVKPISGMSEDRTVCTNTRGQLLPPAPFSVFIKDQEKGDLKRLKSYAADGVSNPQFNLSSYCDAYYCNGVAMTVYESWYY